MNVFRFNQNIKPDGSDDPPVLADVDTQFSSWVQCAPSFSQHVYAWMWDYALVLGKLRGDDLIDDLVIEALSQPLSEESLGFVRNHFQAELVTQGWPGDTQYRLFTGDQRILIWDSKKQADWFLSAKSTEALGQLANLVSPFTAWQASYIVHSEACQVRDDIERISAFLKRSLWMANLTAALESEPDVEQRRGSGLPC